jgi:tetratricopeptide (TPR) repeat protein
VVRVQKTGSGEATLYLYSITSPSCSWNRATSPQPGPEHPNTATILYNLALLLPAQGNLAAARPRFERARAIWEKVLGPEHPNTAPSLDNLAALLRDQSDLEGALTAPT